MYIDEKWNEKWQEYVKKIRLHIITEASAEAFEVLENMNFNGVVFEQMDSEMYDGIEELMLFTYQDEKDASECTPDGVVAILDSYVEENVEHLSKYFKDFPFEDMISEYAEFEGIL